MDLWPERDRVVLGGDWLKSDGKGGFVIIGQLVSFQCPQCGMDLLSGTDGRPKWVDIDPRLLRWIPAPPVPE